MRAQKLREKASEKERDEHFNIIQPMFPTKQEWRVKEKTSAPALTASDDDMELLIDGGAAVNLMPHSLFKKLGREDEELVKTNLTLNNVGGNPMEARGVMSIELTVGSKSLATTFFIIEVPCNYSIILGRDWIHANRCLPSTLHQFFIQWINDEIKVVHTRRLTLL
jgi:hypothetical protein